MTKGWLWQDVRRCLTSLNVEKVSMLCDKSKSMLINEWVSILKDHRGISTYSCPHFWIFFYIFYIFFYTFPHLLLYFEYWHCQASENAYFRVTFTPLNTAQKLLTLALLHYHGELDKFYIMILVSSKLQNVNIDPFCKGWQSKVRLEIICKVHKITFVHIY